MNADKRDLLVLPLAVVVLVAWAAAFVRGLVTGDFEALTYTTPLMLTLAGYVFGVQIVRKKDD